MENEDHNILYIQIPNPKKNVVKSEFVHVKHEHLPLLHGCWIKYSTGNVMEIGGILTLMSATECFLRIPQRKTVNAVKIDKNTTFYCKQSTENYKALQEIVKEKEKLKIKTRQLQHQIDRFNKTKDAFHKFVLETLPIHNK